jgi:hypothetical protein
LTYNITKTEMFKTRAARHTRVLIMDIENLAYVQRTTSRVRAVQD